MSATPEDPRTEPEPGSEPQPEPWPEESCRIFMAAPFAQLVADGERVDATWRDRLETLRLALLDRGHAVFNAHHNEDWGAAGLPPRECVPSDFRAMLACDVVCAYLGSPVSAGVAVELGWASLLRKPVVLAHDRGATVSPMLRGLDSLTRVTRIVLPRGLDEAGARELAEATDRLAEAALADGASPWRCARLTAPLRYVAATGRTK
ncbi:hypothetical protein [Streptomyces sp. PT12]|uniref:hypothetical protein n=1 Tax=Streptomyces sp. PT12 TaxID=1510197 RepID=UPI0015EEAFB1|nr:hypothetical protein [Streptomyces sp. PT12]